MLAQPYIYSELIIIVSETLIIDLVMYRDPTRT